MPGCGSKQIDGQYCLDVFETGDRQGQIIELAGVRDELLELVSMDVHALSLQGKHHPPPGLADLKNQDRVYDLCKRRLKNLGNVLRRWLASISQRACSTRIPSGLESPARTWLTPSCDLDVATARIVAQN